jgi:hypothetical protein
MWPGSYFNSGDEWLEIRNLAPTPIDISGWQLSKLTGSGAFGPGPGQKHHVDMLTIPNGKTIPANGFFLISRLSKSASNFDVTPNLINTNLDLRNSNLQIKLYQGVTDPNNLIDTADDGIGSSAAGFNGVLFNLSMERNDIPGNGILASSWHTCVDSSAEEFAYWDNPLAAIFNHGTPGGRNLSDTTEEALRALVGPEEQWVEAGIYAPDPSSVEDDYNRDETIPEEVLLAEKQKAAENFVPNSDSEIVAPEVPVDDNTKVPETDSSPVDDSKDVSSDNPPADLPKEPDITPPPSSDLQDQTPPAPEVKKEDNPPVVLEETLPQEAPVEAPVQDAPAPAPEGGNDAQ